MDCGRYFSFSFAIVGSLCWLWTVQFQVGYTATWAPSVGLNQIPFANMEGWSRDWVRRQAQTVSIERFLTELLKHYANSGNGRSFVPQTDASTPSTISQWTDIGGTSSITSNNILPMINENTNSGLVSEHLGGAGPNGVQPSSGFNQAHNAGSVTKNIFINNFMNSNRRTTIQIDNRLSSDSAIQGASMTPFSFPSTFTLMTFNSSYGRLAPPDTKAQTVSLAQLSKNGSAPKRFASNQTVSSANNTDAILSKIKFPSLEKMIKTIDNKETVKNSSKTKCDKSCPIADVCNNGGTCINTCSGFTCVCPKGFTGFFCDTMIDAKRAGKSGNTTTTISPGPNTITGKATQSEKSTKIPKHTTRRPV